MFVGVIYLLAIFLLVHLVIDLLFIERRKRLAKKIDYSLRKVRVERMEIFIIVILIIYLFDFTKIRKQNETMIKQKEAIIKQNEKMISLLEDIKREHCKK